MPSLAGAVGAVLAAAIAATLAVAGCSSSPTASPSVATYPVPTETVRLHEVPVHAAAVRDGDVRLQVIGFTDRIPVITGTHAEWYPRGTYMRVRLLAQDVGLDAIFLVTRQQELIDSAGHVYHPDPDAMRIKRQPDDFDLAPSDRVEFDLWYDVPLGTTAHQVRLFGSPPSTGGQLVDLPAGAPTPTP